MTTAELITAVKSRLLEENGSSFSDASIVSALNEAYEHLYGVIVDLDPDGEVFGVEALATYTGGSSSVTWETLLTEKLLKLHSLEQVSSSQYDPIPLTNRRREQYRSRRWNDLVGIPSRTGLRLRQYGAPPSSDVDLNVSYTPAPTLMSTAAPAVEPPFLVECYSALAAYAATVKLMDAETPTGAQQQRFDQLENDVRVAVTRSVQTQSAPEVYVSDTSEYDCYD